MSFLAPGFLLAAGLASLVVIGLHLLSTHDPKLEPLPTARFVPEVLVRATATTVRPTDLWLLLLRVALVLLFGAALARPVVTPPHSPVARIVAVDVSRAVGRPAELADSSRRYLAGASTVILFDSTARVVSRGAADSLSAPASTSAPASKSVPAPKRTPAPARQGSLSAALVAALRAAALLREGADSLELVVVSPFAVEEHDAATDALRALWPGRLTTVAVTPAVAKPQGPVEVEWADSSASALWIRRETPDTISGLRGNEAVLIYPFVRQWRAAAPPDSLTRV